MRELILLKSGEIALKGLNRSTFEDRLIKNAKNRLYHVGKFKFYKAQSTLYAEPLEDCDLDKAVDCLRKVFGFSALSRACIVEKDFEAIKAASVEYLRDALEDARTFKVAAKRSDKAFPMKSPEICHELGGYLLEQFPHLRVDVHEPQVTVTVEIRDFAAYIHENQIPGAGGIPVGSGGNAMLMLSGGIDSPVAGYMMAKRGLRIVPVHFTSPPYTSERSLMKVQELCRKLVPYIGRMRFLTVPFTKLQEQLRDNCPEDLLTIILRRFMIRVCNRLAETYDCGALVTGESVGQVASQTVSAIACTQAAAEIPVLRPVIGMDKEEIIAIARKIDTFETSILPYEDCCTVFTPRHPKTKPKLAEILAAEQALDAEALIAEAIAGTTLQMID